MKRFLTLLTVVLLTPGCGTFFARTGWRDEGGAPRFYPAIHMDVSMIRSGVAQPSKMAWTCVGVLDMPVSLASDTLCMPLDIWGRNSLPSGQQDGEHEKPSSASDTN